MGHPQRKPARTMRRIATVLALLLLAGCNVLGSGSSELAAFGLDVRVPRAGDAPAAWQIVVDEPAATGTLASPRITRHGADGEYGVFAGARWVDRAPLLVQDALVRAFEDSGRVAGVGRPSSSVRGDYALITVLRRFQGEGDDEVAITLSAQLVRYASNEVLAARVFDASVAVDGSGMAAVVAAFDRAFAELAPQIVAWSVETGNADAAARAKAD